MKTPPTIERFIYTIGKEDYAIEYPFPGEGIKSMIINVLHEKGTGHVMVTVHPEKLVVEMPRFVDAFRVERHSGYSMSRPGRFL